MNITCICMTTGTYTAIHCQLCVTCNIGPTIHRAGKQGLVMYVTLPALEGRFSHCLLRSYLRSIVTGYLAYFAANEKCGSTIQKRLLNMFLFIY